MSSTRIAFVVTHPIQYYSPWFAHLAGSCDLTVYYAHRQTPEGQADAGFSTQFEWDLPLLDGYRSKFLKNVAKRPSLGTFGGCDTPEIAGILRNGGFDAVALIGWNKKCFLQAGIAAHRAGIPLLIRLDSQLRTPRSAWKRALKRPVYTMVLPWAANYLSPGQRSDCYLRHFGVPAVRIHRLAHMVDVQRFASASREARTTGAAAEARRSRATPSDAFVFLFVGKLIHKKQPLILLEALSRLQSAGLSQKTVLWIAGDGPLEQEMHARARQRGLAVEFLGFVNQTQLPAVYAAADCLVLPSSEETWGLVVNEAMACGLPAIVSDEAGCRPELIVDDVTGWAWRGKGASSLAELMARAVARARDLPRGPIEDTVNSGTYEVGTRQFLHAVKRLSQSRIEPWRAARRSFPAGR